MSASFSCHCPERKKPVQDRNWVVMARQCNYSHFEAPKGQWHSSDWSTVVCLSCRACGQTKAKYVSQLRDYEGGL